MKKAICTIFYVVVVLYIFPATAFANDFSDKAISTFQEYRKLNDEMRAAFMSGDSAVQKEKGKLLSDLEENFNNTVKSLPKEYCDDPQDDLLREFIKTLISVSEEYPTYVFAELYVCNPDRIAKEILSLTPEENKRKIFDDLEWGFKNIAYKVESRPNYKELKKRLKNLKKEIHGK
jgi:hypothetical protein